jgi:hypothetical protein
MNGNKDRMIDNASEWQLGFGQVASLVALFTVVYAVVLSYQDYLIKLRERNQSEDSATTTEGNGNSKKDMEMAFVAL